MVFPRQIRANTISFTVFPEIVPSIGNSFINTMKNINHTRSSISDDIRNILFFPYTTLFRSLPHVRATHQPLRAVQCPGPGPSQDHLARRARHLSGDRSEEHTSELQSPCNLVCRLLLEKKKKK